MSSGEEAPEASGDGPVQLGRCGRLGSLPLVSFI